MELDTDFGAELWMYSAELIERGAEGLSISHKDTDFRMGSHSIPQGASSGLKLILVLSRSP